MSESKQLYHADGATGKITVFSRYTGNKVLSITLPVDDDWVAKGREIERGIRAAEDEAMRHASSEARKAILKLADEI